MRCMGCLLSRFSLDRRNLRTAGIYPRVQHPTLVGFVLQAPWLLVGPAEVFEQVRVALHICGSLFACRFLSTPESHNCGIRICPQMCKSLLKYFDLRADDLMVGVAVCGAPEI